MLREEIQGVNANTKAKELGRKAAEKTAAVNRLIATVRTKALVHKVERLNSTKQKLESANDTLEQKSEIIKQQSEQIVQLRTETEDMGNQIENLMLEIEKLNRLRVEEIQKTYDVFISYLHDEKKQREAEVENAKGALNRVQKERDENVKGAIETLGRETSALEETAKSVTNISKAYEDFIKGLHNEKKTREKEVKDAKEAQERAKKARDQEIKEAKNAVEREMKTLEETENKLEEIMAERIKHNAIDQGADEEGDNVDDNNKEKLDGDEGVDEDEEE